MNRSKRINPHRAETTEVSGVRRITLQKQTRPAIEPDKKPLRTKHDPQQWMMAVVHSDRGHLDEHARQAIAAAAILAGLETGVFVVVLGELSEDLAPLGADLIATLPELDAGRFQPERETAAVSALMKAYSPVHVFLPDIAHSTGDLGRRLIAVHAGSAAAHVIEIDRQHVKVRWSSNSAVGVMALPCFILLEPGVVDTNLPVSGPANLVPAHQLPSPVEPLGSCRDLGLEQLDASQLALEEASSVVSAGHGVDNIATLTTLAETLGAAVGASRVAVDEGKFSREKQIGATGKSISANLYVAVGISGAVQHLQGIKDCRHVIAINRDAGAPIVKRADLAVIGDAEELMQALISRLVQAQRQSERSEAP
jgi:electron transfer flavoprotein alpha subunit